MINKCKMEKTRKNISKKFFRKKNKILRKFQKRSQNKKSRCLKKILKTKNFVLKNTKNDPVKREINIFSKFLQKMKAGIMPDPPVEYLRKCNFGQNRHLFSSTFIFSKIFDVSGLNRSHYI